MDLLNNLMTIFHSKRITTVALELEGFQRDRQVASATTRVVPILTFAWL